jgi:hypothetical protein
MEFKEFGPLEQSKEIVENKKTTWGAAILFIGFGVIATMVYSNFILQQFRENQLKMKDKI